MDIVKKITRFIKNYLPMFFLICFSGNPIVTHMNYSKTLLVGYTIIFIIYTLFLIDLKLLRKASGIFSILFIIIFVLILFQRITLGFVSYPGVFGYIVKILLTLSTLLYYQNEKIDFIDAYIKVLAFLAFISIPFFILNQIGFYGIQLESVRRKSFFIYTTLLPFPNEVIARSSGMFWEPGAFAGYLILAIVFIALKNRKFQIGPYGREFFWIFIGLLTTMSTNGFVNFGIILIAYAWQNFSWGRIVVIPVSLVIVFIAYLNLPFMKDKVEDLYIEAIEMDENDISANRFGAFKMDLQYIKSQPIIGNGMHIKTRFRFHPQVKGDIGHGNGMSNFMASWGIPFFMFWLLCVYKFVRKVSNSTISAITSFIIIVLLLQGEQFLNYPIYLSFFFLPFLYENILSVKSKIHIIEDYLNIKLTI